MLAFGLVGGKETRIIAPARGQRSRSGFII
jgi:hypothetical protein